MKPEKTSGGKAYVLDAQYLVLLIQTYTLHSTHFNTEGKQPRLQRLALIWGNGGGLPGTYTWNTGFWPGMGHRGS